MPLYLPDFSEIMAVAETRGEDSDAPHLWRGLGASWPLQETGGVTAFDIVARRDGTLTGGPTRSIGDKGRIVTLDGNDDYVSVPVFPPIGTADFTVSVWVRLAAGYLTTDQWMGRGDTGAGEWMFGLSGGAKTMRFYGNTAGINATGVTNLDTVVGVWQLMTATRKGATVSLYRNGAIEGSDGTAGDSLSDTTHAVEIGTCDAAGALDRTMLGSIMLPEIWIGRALSQEEIKERVADPWAMYRLRTVVHPVAVAEPSGFKPYWLRRSTQIIGGGIAA